MVPKLRRKSGARLSVLFFYFVSPQSASREIRFGI
jgi:hypothetical protein